MLWELGLGVMQMGDNDWKVSHTSSGTGCSCRRQGKAAAGLGSAARQDAAGGEDVSSKVTQSLGTS